MQARMYTHVHCERAYPAFEHAALAFERRHSPLVDEDLPSPPREPFYLSISPISPF